MQIQMTWLQIIQAHTFFPIDARRVPGSPTDGARPFKVSAFVSPQASLHHFPVINPAAVHRMISCRDPQDIPSKCSKHHVVSAESQHTCMEFRDVSFISGVAQQI